MTRPVLPPRARLALELLSTGWTCSEIAAQMVVSQSGVWSALQTARNKLDARTTYEAVAVAVRRGLIP